MDSNQKFWIWLWLIVGITFIFCVVIFTNTVTTQSQNEYKAITELVNKGYTANQASCSITHDSDVCRAVISENVIKIKKEE